MNSELIGMLPHTSSMLLIDKLISTNDSSAVIEATIKKDYPFSNEITGSWIGLELMAQSAAVLSKLRSNQKLEKPALGFLLGTRNFTAQISEFSADQKVFIEVQLDPESKGQSIVTTNSIIRDASGQLICEAVLTLFEPNNDALYLSK